MAGVTPDPQAVREIARKFLEEDPNPPADQLDYLVRQRTGYGITKDEFQVWLEAVNADVQAGTVTIVATWPDEPHTAMEELRNEILAAQFCEEQGADLQAVAALLAVYGEEASAEFDAVMELTFRFEDRIAALSRRR